MPSASSRHLSRRARGWIVRALVATAGISAAVSVDVTHVVHPESILTFGLVGLLIGWSLATSKRWAWPLAAGGAAFMAEGPMLWLALLALVGALAALQMRRRNRVVGALVGLAVVTALFRLPIDDVAFGLPTLVGVVSVAPATISALVARRKRWRPIALGVAALVVVVAGLSVLAGMAAFSAKEDVEAALDRSRTALDLVQNDDRAGAVGEFELAAAGFGDAADTASAPWVVPARLIPVVGQHLIAVEEMAEAGQRLATTSAETIDELDLDNLTFSGGRIDLDRIAALEAPAAALVDGAIDARRSVEDARSDWLIPQMADRIDELAIELDEAIDAGQTTVDAVRVAPYFLGADEPRRYLVEFSSPAESRELGGLMGGFGFLTADDGKLEFDSRGGSTELIDELTAADPERPEIRLTSAFLAQAPLVEPRAWTGTADFPTAATVARTALAAIGEDVDGVILVDPYTLAALMEFTGPVTIPGIDRTVTPGDAVDFLLRDQYIEFEGEQAERKDLLGELGGQVFEQLTNGALPSPPQVAAALAPLVEQRRLMAVVDDPEAMALLDDTGMSGRVEVADESEEVITVASTNIRPTKIDAFVQRRIEVKGRALANGEARGTITVDLENRVPNDGLNDYVLNDDGDGGGIEVGTDGLPPATHWMFLAVYSSMEFTEASIDGKLVALAAEPAFGMTRYAVLVQIPQGEDRTVEFTISDRVDPRGFSLRYVPFAAAIPDDVSISFATP